MLLERVVCGACRTPMRCTQTSVPVVYNDSVVYHGTEFTCPKCGNVVIPITSEQSMDVYGFKRPNNTIEVDE